MAGRFLVTLLLALMFAGHSLAVSSTPSGSLPSIAASGSASAAAPSTTGSASTPPTPSGTHPPPPPPVNLTNHYPGCALRPDNTPHIYYLCVAWQDPSGKSSYWIVTASATGQTPVTVTTYYPAAFVNGLQPNTAYTISVVGYDYAGRASSPLTGSGPSYTTDPLDAKTDPQVYDLQNLACTPGTSTTTFRKVITCTWGSPPVLPIDIHAKGRCIATGSHNKVVHKLLAGSATSVTLPINRSAFTCYIEIFGTYLNHKANNGRGHRFVTTCSSSTNSCTVVH